MERFNLLCDIDLVENLKLQTAGHGDGYKIADK
jgi:hypothetical protein